MLEHELQQYLLREYPQENARCEWKEFKNLKNSFCGNEKDDGSYNIVVFLTICISYANNCFTL